MRIYCNYDENGNVINCKEYDFGGLGEEYAPENDDMVNYCFSNEEETECNNPNFRDSENWKKYYPESGRYIDAGMFSSHSVDLENLADYTLSEVRIKAIGGTVGISYILPEGCLTGLRMFQLRATANCYGVYRGKEVLIPEQKWHNTIFDYVIFNGEGSLQNKGNKYLHTTFQYVKILHEFGIIYGDTGFLLEYDSLTKT